MTIMAINVSVTRVVLLRNGTIGKRCTLRYKLRAVLHLISKESTLHKVAIDAFATTPGENEVLFRI